MRPEVKAFATLMEKALKENESKGGWDERSYEDLATRAGDHGAIVQENASTNSNPSEVLKHCVHMANYLMMIADNFGGLEVEPRATPGRPTMSMSELRRYMEGERFRNYMDQAARSVWNPQWTTAATVSLANTSTGRTISSEDIGI